MRSDVYNRFKSSSTLNCITCERVNKSLKHFPLNRKGWENTHLIIMHEMQS